MTRINANLHPEHLLDQHLMAEYRELPMVYAALRRSLRTKSVNDVLKSVPPRFTLNKGHVSFFYDKITFLEGRYERLIDELKTRGYNLDDSRRYDVSDIPEVFHNTWEMDDLAKQQIQERIYKRYHEKPTFYTYYGSHVDDATIELMYGNSRNSH